MAQWKKTLILIQEFPGSNPFVVMSLGKAPKNQLSIPSCSITSSLIAFLVAKRNIHPKFKTKKRNRVMNYRTQWSLLHKDAEQSGAGVTTRPSNTLNGVKDALLYPLQNITALQQAGASSKEFHFNKSSSLVRGWDINGLSSSSILFAVVTWRLDDIEFPPKTEASQAWTSRKRALGHPISVLVLIKDII